MNPKFAVTLVCSGLWVQERLGNKLANDPRNYRDYDTDTHYTRDYHCPSHSRGNYENHRPSHRQIHHR
jgi:hypothetical protein